MADFSNQEKINATWKHIFNILGTYNGSGSAGKFPYEEALTVSHIVSPDDIWADPVIGANTVTQARANAVEHADVIEDRSDGTGISLTAFGADWKITSIIPPKVGYQITDTFPSPAWIRSITAVTPLGGNLYQITLNSNAGVGAGSAILHRRIFLTPDPTTNGISWFCRSIYGDHFSDPIQNFILPQKAGKGYSPRIYRANGQEILTTEGAWIVNCQKGLVLFASGYTPTNLNYQQPLYLEGFRYIGETGAGTSVADGELNDTLRFDGADWVPNSSLKSDGTSTTVENLAVSGSLIIDTLPAPAASGDDGLFREMRMDENFVYFKTGAGWKRIAMNLF